MLTPISSLTAPQQALAGLLVLMLAVVIGLAVAGLVLSIKLWRLRRRAGSHPVARTTWPL